MNKMPLRKSHSWWWDSHISPKNSRWLSENLERMNFIPPSLTLSLKNDIKSSISEMDGVVMEMLKLVEEDGDTFAKKADMYYQRRPELISRVEDFYRMYRALAERYDMASGELRRNTPSDLQSQASSISSSDFVLEPASPSFSLSSDITPGRKPLKTESSSEFGSDTEGGEEKEAAAERLRALEDRVRELEAEQMQARSALVECTLERANLKNEIVEERKKSVELREEVERQRALVLDGEEGKREAIRQLCFSLDHYRDAYHKLRQLPPTKSPAACAIDSGKKHSYIGRLNIGLLHVMFKLRSVLFFAVVEACAGGCAGGLDLF